MAGAVRELGGLGAAGRQAPSRLRIRTECGLAGPCVRGVHGCFHGAVGRGVADLGAPEEAGQARGQGRKVASHRSNWQTGSQPLLVNLVNTRNPATSDLLGPG